MLNVAHLARVDLNLLVLFHAVLEERHVGRAASRLSLTPSAVSHGLARLRLLFNDPLFLRMPKGVVPTERALALQAPVAEMLSAVQGTLGTATPFDPATSRRRFLIGAPDAVLASSTLPLLERVGASAPGIDIGLVHLLPAARERHAEGPWAECLGRLERRELDAAMLPLRVLPARFHAQPLYEEDFVVAMRRGHPFSRRPTEANFVAAKHLLVSMSGESRGFVDEALAARGRERRIVLTVPSFSMALELLAGTDLLAALPRRLVRRHAARLGLAAAELPFERRADSIQAIATKSAMRDAGVAWLMATLVDLLARGR